MREIKHCKSQVRIRIKLQFCENCSILIQTLCFVSESPMVNLLHGTVIRDFLYIQWEYTSLSERVKVEEI